MAMMNISYDTKSKKMMCSMDGNEMANVVGCYLGRSSGSGDDYMCELTMFSRDEENDMATVTRVMAAKADGTEELVEKKEKKFSAEVLQEEILKYFGRE